MTGELAAASVHSTAESIACTMSTVIAGDGCWRLQLLLLLLAGAVAVLRSASYAADRTPVLVPNVPLSDQAVADGGTAVYLLEDLKASTSYEVRISYPASVCPS